MKKILSLLLILSAFAQDPAAAQQITMSTDSVATLLCKKWEVTYSIVGGTRVDMLPGTSAIDLEFMRDKTMWLSSAGDPKKTKGNWVYDADRKSIKLVVGGKTRMKVIRLQPDRLEIMSVDIKEATPDDPGEVTMVCKVKSS